MKNGKRSSFSGKLGYVLAAAGASVGLGNIWRFPYLAAKYGGGIFLIIYIVLALTFGYTMIVAETAIGRMTRKSPVGAFKSFGKKKWLSFGGITLVCCMSVLTSEPMWSGLFQLGIFLVIPLIQYCYNGEGGSKKPFHKWFFYFFYPAHLLLLGICKQVL